MEADYSTILDLTVAHIVRHRQMRGNHIAQFVLLYIMATLQNIMAFSGRSSIGQAKITPKRDGQ